jgi:hemerythrin-like metal-binding protein
MGEVSSFIAIEWRAEWESGIAIIDDQHRTLVNHSREILNMIVSGTDKLALDYMIDHLIAHVEEHFHDEEEELEYANYPYLAEHKNLHRSLIKEAEEFNTAYKKGKADVKDLFHLVYDKIVMEHMLSADRKFFPFLTKTRDT